MRPCEEKRAYTHADLYFLGYLKGLMAARGPCLGCERGPEAAMVAFIQHSGSGGSCHPPMAAPADWECPLYKPFDVSEAIDVDLAITEAIFDLRRLRESAAKVEEEE